MLKCIRSFKGLRTKTVIGITGYGIRMYGLVRGYELGKASMARVSV